MPVEQQQPLAPGVRPGGALGHRGYWLLGCAAAAYRWRAGRGRRLGAGVRFELRIDALIGVGGQFVSFGHGSESRVRRPPVVAATARVESMSDTSPFPARDPLMGGFNKVLGLVIDEHSGELVRGHVTVHQDLLQPYGIVHGGVYSSLAETTASVGAAMWHMGRVPEGRTVGVSNSTNFVRAVHEGVTITVVATPVHRGRTLQLWQVDMTDDDGRLVARGQVQLANLAPDRPI